MPIDNLRPYGVVFQRRIHIKVLCISFVWILSFIGRLSAVGYDQEMTCATSTMKGDPNPPLHTLTL